MEQEGRTLEDTSCFSCILWRHQRETFSALLALWEGNPLVTSGFASQMPVTQTFIFDLRPNIRLRKQSRRRWFETPSRPLWRHCNGCFVVWLSPFAPLNRLSNLSRQYHGCSFCVQENVLFVKLNGKVGFQWMEPLPVLGLCQSKYTLIARFMGPTWGLPGADRTQVGPMWAPCVPREPSYLDTYTSPVGTQTKCCYNENIDMENWRII